MTFYCKRCNSYTHAEEWHSFSYRRQWIKRLKKMHGDDIDPRFEKQYADLLADFRNTKSRIKS